MFNFFRGKSHLGIFRQVPLPTRGKLYGSPMPFGAYDPGNRLLKIYKQHHISHVFLLNTDEELEKKARKNIKKLYDENRMGWSQFPIVDFQAPTIDILIRLTAEAVRILQKQNVVVHCHAGVGRTAVAICGIVRVIENLSAASAIDYVTSHMPVEMTSEQINLVEKFNPSTINSN
jgi:protein-tyrosine phosphatase